MTLTNLIGLREAVLTDASTTEIRPRFEGSNICTWIGFKHVNYLVEEAVLEHFRRHGMSAGALYEAYGLCLDLVEIDTRILSALHIDDLVTAEVMPTTGPGARELSFAVTVHVPRSGGSNKAVTSKVRVVLRADDRDGPLVAAPPWIERFTVRRIERGGAEHARVDPTSERGSTGGANVLEQLTRGTNAFGWKWRIPYFYCHFTERVQMSGYLRLMEEVVDLFLADRGVSIKDLLDDRNWIPVVPRSSLSMVGEAIMEEDMYTVFTVEDIFKDFTYTARVDCYVQRGHSLHHTATGRITHGYAVITSRRDWSLVNFDDRMLTALRGSEAQASNQAGPPKLIGAGSAALKAKEASWNAF